MLQTTSRTLVALLAGLIAATGSAASGNATDCERDGSAKNLSACIEQAPEIALENLTPPLTLPPDVPTYDRQLRTTPSAPAPPALAGPRADLDVWRKIEGDTDLDDGTRVAKGALGADYRIGRSARVGVKAEAEETAQQRGLIQRESRTIGAHLGYKPSPHLKLEAEAGWGKTGGAVAGQAYDNQEGGLSASVKSNLSIGKLKVAPSVTIKRGVTESAGGLVQKDTITLAPHVSRPLQLEGGRTLEPFVTFKDEIDISATATDGKSATRSAGAGLKLDNPDRYSLSVTTNVEDLDASQRNVNSQLRLKVPIK